MGIPAYPVEASAAWWNPWTWFDSETGKTLDSRVQITATQKATTTSEAQTQATNGEKLSEVKDELALPRIEYKEDPKQQEEIVALTAQVRLLREQLDACHLASRTQSTYPVGAQQSPLSANADTVTGVETLTKIESCRAERDASRAGLVLTVEPMVNSLATKYKTTILSTLSSQLGSTIEPSVLALQLGDMVERYKNDKRIQIQSEYDNHIAQKYETCIKNP